MYVPIEYKPIINRVYIRFVTGLPSVERVDPGVYSGGHLLFRGSLNFRQKNKCHVHVPVPCLSEGKPQRMRVLCLKTSGATGRGGLGINSSSVEYVKVNLRG